MSDDTLHDQVKAAYDAATTPEQDVVEEVVEEIIDEPVEQDDIAEDVIEEGDDDLEEIDAPKRWSKEDRAKFKTLDVSAKDLLVRRHREMEAGYTKKQQALAEDQRYAEEFRKTLSPYDAYLKQNNINPQQAFDKLLSAEMRLRQAPPHEKAAILHDLARHYGADFNPREDAAPDVDPQIKFMYDKIAQQEAYLARMEQDRQQQETRGYQSQIDEFVGAKDTKGNLIYPHFEDVRPDMALLLQNGRAQNLPEAYKKAVLLNEDLKSDAIKQHTKDEDSRKRAAASKNASFNVKSASTSRISDPKEHISIRDSVARAYDAGDRI